MNMKKKSDRRVFVWVLAMLFLITACKDQEGEHASIGDPVNIEAQTVSPNQQVLSRQGTVKLSEISRNLVIQAQGYIVPNPNRNQAVAARISGRIEKLHVKFSGQKVKKGDKIMDLYSPDLLTFQEEHLFLIGQNGDKKLQENSRKKLVLLGMHESQIQQLEKKGTVSLAIGVYSPANGYVFFDTQAKPDNVKSDMPAKGNSMNMQGNEGNREAYAPLMAEIREGTYINEGQTLFNVNDLDEVWALVSVSGQYLSQLAVNQSVNIISEEGASKKVVGKIILIEPAFEDSDQRFVRIRLALSNKDNSLKINNLISAELILPGNGQLQVPSSAVYKTGRQEFVWVKSDTTEMGTGIFQLRSVVARPGQNGYMIIDSGLEGDEEIAIEAGLMSDSETFLNIREHEAN